MAYDEALAGRVRELISGRADVSERKMFGGIAFMVGGNMAVGVTGDELMVRLDPGDSEKALTEKGVRVFDMTGRPMKGWVMVEPDGLDSDSQLRDWIERAVDFVRTLPGK